MAEQCYNCHEGKIETRKGDRCPDCWASSVTCRCGSMKDYIPFKRWLDCPVCLGTGFQAPKQLRLALNELSVVYRGKG